MEEKQRILYRTGKCVALGIIEVCDLETITQGMNDQRTYNFLGNVMPKTREEEKIWIENLFKDKMVNQVFGIYLIAEKQMIGAMGLHRISWLDRIATTGAVIWDPKDCGKGYGSEAKMLLLDYAFNVLNLRKIMSSTLASNARSKRYGEKCGYKVEAVLKEHRFRDGEYVDEIVLSVFADEWRPLWEEFKKTLA